MKQIVQAFSIGILISTLFLSAGHFFFAEKAASVSPLPVELTEKEMIQKLESSGYIVTTKEETLEDETKTDTETKKEAPEESKSKQLTLKIEKGMALSDIVKKINEAEIVEDGDAFSTYMNEQGYSTRIQLGTFDLNSEMSYKEIAKKLTSH